MKRVIFLVMAALLAMLILVPMAVAQDTTMMTTVPPSYGAGGEPALSWLSALWSPRGWRPLSRR
jgi:L-lactate permease